MLKFSKKTQYAMVALLHLHHCGDEGRDTAHCISERHGFPEEYLGKVLQKLARSGLLESVQGAGGGYRLARPFGELTVGAVVDATGERPVPRPDRHAQCAEVCVCYVQCALEDVQTRVMDYLDSLPLCEVLTESNTATA